MNVVPDFWVSSGHRLLDRAEDGGLVVTDDFLRLYLGRPEVLPPPEACAAEQGLHARLMARPRDPVEPTEIAGLAHPDARENWSLLIAFRDRLLEHPTLEAAFLAMLRGGVGATPAIFLNQLVHVILRNALDGETDVHVLRAAECFYRTQRVLRSEGRVLIADEMALAEADGSGAGDGSGAASQPLPDVLGADNAASYQARSDAHDLAIDFRPDGPGQRGLARAVERWLAHMIDLETQVRPMLGTDELPLHWFIGLDQEATRLGNAWWDGEPPDSKGLDRAVGLFTMRVRDEARVVERLRGHPVLLIMASTETGLLRLRPQNLITGLPLTGLRTP